MRSSSSQRGFTQLEVGAVLAISGTLLALVLGGHGQFRESERDAHAIDVVAKAVAAARAARPLGLFDGLERRTLKGVSELEHYVDAGNGLNVPDVGQVAVLPVMGGLSPAGFTSNTHFDVLVFGASRQRCSALVVAHAQSAERVYVFDAGGFRMLRDRVATPQISMTLAQAASGCTGVSTVGLTFR